MEKRKQLEVENHPLGAKDFSSHMLLLIIFD